MPLIMLCGLPCSGKSTVCRLLVEELQSLAKARGRAVDCITVEEFAGADVHSTDGYNPRAVVFSDSHREREMRSRLKSDVSITLLFCMRYFSSLIICQLAF